MSRPTDDLKDRTVKIRINEETYEYLIDKSNSLDISVSEYLRNLIVEDMISDCKVANNIQ